MSEEQQRTWALGTSESREAIRDQLEQSGMASETKAINLDDVAQLLRERAEAAEAAKHVPTPDEIMMQTFIASGLDPALLDTWRATAAEQQIPFAAFVMGHIVNAQQRGELNAPARDQGWAMAPEGSGGVMIETMTYTCQNHTCGKEDVGRLGQLYCSNVCAAEHKRYLAAQAEAAEQQGRLQRLRNSLMNVLGFGGQANLDDMQQVEQILAGNVAGMAQGIDPVVQQEMAALGATGVAVDTETAAAQSAQGRQVFRLG